jgi:DNA-3-methyladenine glycosylase
VTGGRRCRQLGRRFYSRPSPVVAPELLNKILVIADGRAGRIVETEAYFAAEAASHSFRGPTARNAVMFGPPGHLYVYFTYGMHWCCNPVCGDHDGQAVLIRALAPLAGIERMHEARQGRSRRPLADGRLCNGPAKLCQALGIDGSANGIDLVAADAAVRIVDDGTPPPEVPSVGTRIGITAAAELPLRWWVEGERHVSRRG